MDIDSAEQSAFKADEVQKIVTSAIETHLKNEKYEEARVSQWINDICELVIAKLHSSKKPFKYAVTCVIAQRTGEAVHSASSCYWDSVSDGTVAVCWPKRNSRDPNNQSMFAIVTVFASNLFPS